MAHLEQLNFISKVKQRYPNFFVNVKVLECGSLNINGTVRDFFSNCVEYLGVDIVQGACVDKVCKASEVFYPEYFDVVISCEMLEHDNEWQQSLESMYFNLRHGGLLLLTFASEGRPEHGTVNSNPQDSPGTNNYYRNLNISDLCMVFNMEKHFSSYTIEYDAIRGDLYFYGIKR